MYQFNTIRLFKNKASGIIIKIVIIIFLYKFLKSSPILKNYIVRFVCFMPSKCDLQVIYVIFPFLPSMLTSLKIDFILIPTFSTYLRHFCQYILGLICLPSPPSSSPPPTSGHTFLPPAIRPLPSFQVIFSFHYISL